VHRVPITARELVLNVTRQYFAKQMRFDEMMEQLLDLEAEHGDELMED
jgi:hypothetical protein